MPIEHVIILRNVGIGVALWFLCGFMGLLLLLVENENMYWSYLGNSKEYINWALEPFWKIQTVLVGPVSFITMITHPNIRPYALGFKRAGSKNWLGTIDPNNGKPVNVFTYFFQRTTPDRVVRQAQILEYIESL